MVISWYGEGCFKLQEGDFVIAADPLSPGSGLTPPRFKSNLLLKTLTSFPPASASAKVTPDALFEISSAGEYDVSGVSVLGFSVAKESGAAFLKTIYVVDAFGMTLCFLGHLSGIPEDAATLEYLTDIDILFIPAGGKPFLEQKEAVKFVKDSEPKIVIPGFFKVPGLTRHAGALTEFLEAMGQSKTEPQEKLIFKKKDLADMKAPQVMPLTK